MYIPSETEIQIQCVCVFVCVCDNEPLRDPPLDIVSGSLLTFSRSFLTYSRSLLTLSLLPSRKKQPCRQDDKLHYPHNYKVASTKTERIRQSMLYTEIPGSLSDFPYCK